MALLTHAPTHTAHSAHIPADTLSAAQQRLVDDTLWTLGIEDGHTANGGGIHDAGARLLTAAATAAAIGLNLPVGDEIAQCTNCRVIAPTRDIRETGDGRWLCTIPDPDGTTCHGLYGQQ